MPFISDGVKWFFIDDEETYDRNRFAIVNTLHIKLNTNGFDALVSVEFKQQNSRLFAMLSFEGRKPQLCKNLTS